MAGNPEDKWMTVAELREALAAVPGDYIARVNDLDNIAIHYPEVLDQHDYDLWRAAYPRLPDDWYHVGETVPGDLYGYIDPMWGALETFGKEGQ